VETAKNI